MLPRCKPTRVQKSVVCAVVSFFICFLRVLVCFGVLNVLGRCLGSISG